MRENRIVAYVQAEVILEMPQDASVKDICRIMGQTAPWLPGIELRADGFKAPFYRKD